GRPKNIVIYREHYISIVSTKLSSSEAKPGLWPDGLVPKVDEYFGEVRRMPGETVAAFPFNVASGRKQGVWVDVYVPQGTPAGLYKGTAQVTIGSTVATKIPVQLTVRNFDLPSVPTLKTAYSVGLGETAYGHYGTQAITDAKYWEIICLYTKEMLLHKISNENSIWPTPPWNSNTGSITWTLPAISTSCNQRYPQFLTGGDPNLLPNGKLPGTKLTRARMRDGTGLSSTDVRSVAYYRSYTQHIADMGWKSQLFYYLWDEPPYPSLSNTVRSCSRNYVGVTNHVWPDLYQKAKYFSDNAIDIPIMLTTTRQATEECFTNYLGVPNYTKYIDIWTVPNRLMHGRPKDPWPFNTNLRKSYDSIIAAGKQLWWYQGCGNHGCGGSEVGPPTPMVDLPAVYSRAFQWLTYNYQVDYAVPGPTTELYYEAVYAYNIPGNDPWKNLWYFTGNGDGTLLYPGRPDKIGGTHHIPIASIRLKLIREGIEDFEYLSLVAAKKDQAGLDGQAWVKANILDPYVAIVDPADGVRKLTPFAWNKSAGSTTSSTGILRAREELAKVLSSTSSSSPPVSATSISASDSFDRANSSSLGENWNVYTPAYQIYNNQVRNTDTASQEAQRLSIIGANQDVAASCKVAASGNSCGVIARWSNANNFYYVRLDPGLGNIALFKKVNGVYTQIATAARAMAYNTYYRLRLVVKGSSLTVYFANESTIAIAATDVALSAGNYAGLRSYTSAAFTTYFDNFKAATP
ncbi:MAG: DUF4091 domain-containing protein, partial [Nitrospirae bacterium]|nr:DUF4091 domain-containing protein [Candidatus Manganitrophaceae bacterium]